MTLFGIVDVGVASVHNKSNLVTDPALLLTHPLAYAGVAHSVKASRTGMSNSGLASSRLGFRGVEDLGGGLAASFWLEGSLGNDDGSAGTNAGKGGSLDFNRRSTLSLSGNFGELRLGRDYTPTFNNVSTYDPFGTNGVGTSLVQRGAFDLGALPTRTNNSVGYFLPKNLGGFYGQLQYSFHEKTKYNDGLQGTLGNDSRSGGYVGGRFGYANGPLDVAVAYGVNNNKSEWLTGYDQEAKNFSVGATYDFGVVKLFANYARAKSVNETYTDSTFATIWGDETRMDGYLLGLTAPVGAGLIRASYGHVRYKFKDYLTGNGFDQNPKANQFAVGYVHNLSKRTALYTTVAYLKNKNGTDLAVGTGGIAAPAWASVKGYDYAPKTSMGYEFGIRHSF